MQGEPRPVVDGVMDRDLSEGDVLVALIALRDAATAVLGTQAAEVGDDGALAAAQAELHRRYDAYRDRFGPLNRFVLVRTGRRDPTTGEETFRRQFPRMGGFAADPDFYTVLALEVFDPDTHTATKAALFTRRVVTPLDRPLGVDTADQALAVCLDDLGRADLGRVADLLGVDRHVARAELGARVFDDPEGGTLVPAPAYLAGDVRAKLDAARETAATDRRFAVNVEALERVLPQPLGPSEVDARPGASWIPAADIEAFCAEVLGCGDVDVEHIPVTASWALAAPTWQRRHNVAVSSQWGTARADALD
ncbi:MAG: hypothetical protein ACRD0U_07815, partial [Acidimicrobiales bacterium]